MVHLLVALPGQDVLLPNVSWIEKLVRPLLVYVPLLLVFRFTPKWGQAQATLFDFLILLLVSNVVQNAMIGDDNSVLGAIAGALVLVALTYLLDRITSRSHRARVILEGRPTLLIRDGAILDSAMRGQNVTTYDLLSAIRKQGIGRLADVRFALLELDGSISVIRSDAVGPFDCLPQDVVGEDSVEARRH